MSGAERPPLNVTFLGFCLWVVGSLVTYYLAGAAGHAAAAAIGGWLSGSSLDAVPGGILSLLAVAVLLLPLLGVVLLLETRWVQGDRARDFALTSIWLAAVWGFFPSIALLENSLPAGMAHVYAVGGSWIGNIAFVILAGFLVTGLVFWLRARSRTPPAGLVHDPDGRDRRS